MAEKWGKTYKNRIWGIIIAFCGYELGKISITEKKRVK
jgi:hypothetical protein